MTWQILVGDMRDRLAELPEGSIDACVTDPPYELGFMGKHWDRSGVAYRVETWRAIYRVLKPGAHLVAFGGTRTSHRMVCAIEDAGFEIRDALVWLYGQGFPKSLDIGKAIDKAAGAPREVVGYDESKVRPNKENYAKRTDRQPTEAAADGWKDNGATLTAPATPDAKQWDGWGTALKPAHEPIVLARKPLIGTVAANVLAHGTGGINIDACRIATDWSERSESWKRSGHSAKPDADKIAAPPGAGINCHDLGRWPANVLLDEEAAAMLDEQAGEGRARGNITPTKRGVSHVGFMSNGTSRIDPGDSGGASRFFYVAKPSRAERDSGPNRNIHPTVKPVDLMRWLVRLTSPSGGLVLDPFIGSGTTGMACIEEGRNFLGVEKEPDYVALARQRIGNVAPLLATEVARSETWMPLPDPPVQP